MSLYVHTMLLTLSKLKSGHLSLFHLIVKNYEVYIFLKITVKEIFKKAQYRFHFMSIKL